MLNNIVLQEDSKKLAVDAPLQDTTENRLMMYELSCNGHHVVYIRHLVRYWCEHTLAGHFYVVVSPEFVQKHSDIIAIAQQHPNANLSIVAITDEEFASLNPHLETFMGRQRRAWQEWSLICAYAKKLQASHCFLESFDFFQLPFLFGQTLPCPVSGVYFKPTFHYTRFSSYQPTPKAYLQQWREKLTLAAVFRRSCLHRMLCLDPFAVEALNQTFAQGKAIRLADPVETFPECSAPPELRKQLNISDERRIFLLFGDLTERKGVTQLLDAIASLPPTVQNQLCILLVGRCSAVNQRKFQTKTRQIRQTHPVQIIEHYAFVSEQQVQEYFQLTDVVLALYQRHVGMSGILLQAAAAQKPVLSSNYGLMGELVSRYQLGLAVDSTQPQKISQAIQTVINKPLDQLYSASKMAEFCEQNTVEKFASTILNVFESQSNVFESDLHQSTRRQ